MKKLLIAAMIAAFFSTSAPAPARAFIGLTPEVVHLCLTLLAAIDNPDLTGEQRWALTSTYLNLGCPEELIIETDPEQLPVN